jgi:hypothetical protein
MTDQRTEPEQPITVTVTLAAYPHVWSYLRTGIAAVDPAADFRAWVAERIATALDEQPLDHRANVHVDVDGDQPWSVVLAHSDTVTLFRHEQEIQT